MENVGYAALQIIPSMKGFESKLSSGVSGPLRSAGSTGGRLFGNSAGKSMLSSVKSHAKTAALAGAAVFSAVGLAAFKLAKDSIGEARESQKVGAITTAVIKSTGKAANVSAKQVGDLSTALSLKSGIDDEVIQRGANMLLTFKNVRNEVGKNNDIFNQSVAITQDMAAAMAGGKGGDVDLKSSSILVGKALNDPIKGLTALSRVGVSFTDQQKEQIKALVESGDTMKAQKIILGELKSEFGGAAAAQATMGEKVKTAWGNIEEKLGTALLPLLDKVERAFLKKGVPAIEGWLDVFTKKGVPALKKFGHWVTTEGVDKFEDFYHQAKPVAEDVLPAIFDLLKASKPILKTSAGLVGDLAQAFTKIPKWAQVTIAGGLLAGKAGGFKITASLVGKTLATKAAPLPVWVVNQGGVPGVPGEGGGGGSTSFLKKLPFFATRASAIASGPATVAALVKYGYDQDSKLPKDVANRRQSVGSPYGGVWTQMDKGFSKADADAMTANFAKVQAQIEATDTKAAAFKDTLFLTGKTKVDPRFGTPGLPQAQKAVQDFIAAKVKAGEPVSAYFNITNIDRAISQARTLRAELRAAADAARGVDNGVTYQHGGQAGGGGVDGRIAADRARR